MTATKPGGYFGDIWSHPVSRRRLLRAAGLATTTGALAACTSSSPADDASGALSGETGGASATSTVQSATGATSSAFSGGLAYPFLELDPIVQTAFGTVVVSDFIHDALYRLDPFPPREQLSPELAAAIPEGLAPTVYRIALRSDVTFHNGEPFTADDVLFTIGRIKDPDTGSLFAGFFELVDEVVATGTHEIELRLATPTTLLAELLSLVKIQSRPAVEGSRSALELEPVGTGPYRVVSAISEQEITLRRFGDYSGTREFSYDDLTLSVATDPNARVSGLRSRQWKAIEDVPTSTFSGIQSADGLEAEAVPSYRQIDLLFHCGQPPFDDPRVRQAALYAIDRDSITESSFFGEAEPAWSGHLAPEHPSFVEPDHVYRFDPDRARELLAEAGYGEVSIDIDVLIANDVEVISSQGPIIEQNLNDVGFRVNLIPGANEAQYSRVTEGTFHAKVAIRDPSALGLTDAVLLLRLMFTGSFPRQFMHWEGDGLARVEQLIEAAMSAPDVETRGQQLAEVVNALQDEVPLAPLHFSRQLTGWSDDLDGFRPLPTVGLALNGVSG